ncbi:VOC family protein [Vibrio sp. SCSIO 43135]|uniref:VOC family protein n=1 Tax=Vibrio sp. SCSIO 43135 TaxID=2819096 RepID=UPI00207617B2|nr:VOC family protein [Vibrio sp. SCSIO 43135]USD43211.1 VOC family protein [Vibrio sp. SCSIO 43135]
MKLNTLRIPCADLNESEVFYTEKLGLTKVFGSVADGFIGYQLENVQVIIEPEESGEFESGRYLGFSIEVENLADFYARLSECGVEFTGEPEPQFWGGLMTHVIDPSKNTFSVVQMTPDD